VPYPRFMREPLGRDVESATVPSSCPSCGSSSIASAAKRPTAASYWRCVGCGEYRLHPDWFSVVRLHEPVETWHTAPYAVFQRIMVVRFAMSLPASEWHRSGAR